MANNCKQNNKPTRDMIRCCMCCLWYHYRCVDIDPADADQIGVWSCPCCRTIASDVKTILSKMDQLLQITENVQKSHTTLSDKFDTLNDELVACKEECSKLRADNQTLRTKVGDLTSQLNKAVWNTFHKDKNSLLIGDSTIQAIDPKKLVKTHVVVKPSSKIADINKQMDQCAETYSKVVICVGSNECSEESLNPNVVTASFKELLEKAKTKVMTATDVVVSSILPRTDSVDNMNRVQLLNESFLNTAKEANVTFTDNDKDFRLSSGRIPEVFLQDDGVLLTDAGTQQLVRNLALSVKAGCEKNVCRSFSPPKNPPVSSAQDLGAINPLENQRNQGQRNQRLQPQGRGRTPGHYHNNRRPAGGRQPPLTSTHKDRFSGSTAGQWHQRQSAGKMCGFCGEDNHQEDRCRWGEPIACNSCGGLGHKAKLHHHR